MQFQVQRLNLYADGTVKPVSQFSVPLSQEEEFAVSNPNSKTKIEDICAGILGIQMPEPAVEEMEPPEEFREVSLVSSEERLRGGIANLQHLFNTRPSHMIWAQLIINQSNRKLNFSNVMHLIDNRKDIPEYNVRCLRGIAFHYFEKHNEAVVEFAASLKENPNFPTSWSLYQTSLKESKQLDAKIAEMEVQKQKGNLSPFAILELAILKIFTQESDAAELKELIDFSTTQPQYKLIIQYYLADALLKMGEEQRKDGVKILCFILNRIMKEESEIDRQDPNSLGTACLSKLLEYYETTPSLDHSEHLSFINTFVSRHPDLALAHTKKALFYFSHQHIPQAFETAEEALKLNPACRKTLYIKAHCLFLLQKNEEALRTAKLAYQYGMANLLGSKLVLDYSEENNVKLLNLIGDIFSSANKCYGAAWAYLKVYTRDPKSPPIHVAYNIYGSEKITSFTSKIGIEIIEDHLKMHKDDLDVHELCVHFLIHQHFNENPCGNKILRALDRYLAHVRIGLLKNNPYVTKHYHNVLLLTAECHMHLNNRPAALLVLETLLEAEPEHKQALKHAVKVSILMKEFDKCRALIKSLLNYHSQDLKVRLLCASLFLDMQNLKESQRHLKYIEKHLTPEVAGEFKFLSAVLNLNSARTEAEYESNVLLLKDALKLGCENVKATNDFLGETYLKLKKYEEAIEVFSISLKIEIDVNALLMRSKAYSLSNKFSLALGDIDKAKTLNCPKEFIDEALVCYYSCRNNPADLPAISSLIKGNPDNFVIVMLHADLSLQAKQFETALFNISNFIRNHPKHSEIAQAKEKFKELQISKQALKKQEDSDLDKLAKDIERSVRSSQKPRAPGSSKNSGVVDKCKKMKGGKAPAAVKPQLEKMKKAAVQELKVTPVEAVEKMSKETLSSIQELLDNLKKDQNSTTDKSIMASILHLRNQLFTSRVYLSEDLESFLVSINSQLQMTEISFKISELEIILGK